MTTSNTHPETTTLVPRRAFLLRAACGLLATLLLAPAPALAQGLIGFSVGNGSNVTRYEVADNGTGLRTLPFPQPAGTQYYKINATTRSGYPGGRQYLYVQAAVNSSTGTLMVWSEASGQSKAVTNIQGTLAVYLGHCQWSNDGQDHFVSFVLANNDWSQTYTYRAHVSAADLASPSYQPVTLNDPRLELVKDWQGSGAISAFMWWNHDGSRFYYKDPRTGNRNLLRVKTVGVGVTMDDDPVVFTSPVELGPLTVIPPVDPQNPDRYLVTTALPVGTGILAVDLYTSNSWWLATGTPVNAGGPRGQVFSPDGSTVAFGNSRSVTTGTGRHNTTTYYQGVYVVPFFGGPINRVAEVRDSNFLTVNSWYTP